MFRGDWNASIRAFRRVLSLDPTYHLAFQHVQDALLASQRGGCRTPPCTQANSQFIAAGRRTGDTLVLEPVSIATGMGALLAQMLDAHQTHARQRNLEEARQAALEWLQSGQGEARPKIAYGHILLRLGRVDSADAWFRQVTGHRARIEGASLATDRAEVAVKLSHAEEARDLAQHHAASV